MGAPSLQKATLRQLNTFTTVARLGSLSAAARELHISQPAVSMQLRDLEEQCGVALYERAGRKIALTDAGLEIVKCGAAVCEHLRETEEKLADMLGLKTGLLRLDAVTTAKYFAPALLAAFQRQYEAISIRFSVGNREEITRRLSENECDLVIMGRPPKIKDVVAQPFAPHPLVFVAAASHPLVDENSRTGSWGATPRITTSESVGSNAVYRPCS